VHIAESLTQDQLTRYSRHLIIPEIGEKGQKKLLDSKVLMMGAGGLGSPAALYLAAAGVGQLGIIDSDVVDRSNLQRQVLHTDDRVGEPKVESARQTINGLNPDVDVEIFNERLTSDNIMSVFEGYDLVVDGGDNFPTRYLVNDACVKLGIPNVHGSVYRFEGQATAFVPGEGPCYRCLYPEPPPPEFAPSCQEAGVLGVLPGVIGLLQAIEVIKLLVGIGKPLVGRLLAFDGLEAEFRELKLRRDPECPVCGDHIEAEDIEFIDYEQFCSVDI
jgi:molybdopterin/thiamine biosynthesis adenylyltransferase